MEKQRNESICVWCRNKSADVCVPCREEGRYRFLELDTLSSWELPPELPSMRQLVDLPAPERLALMYISVVLEQRQRTKAGDI